jgi:hypothetical protein
MFGWLKRLFGGGGPGGGGADLRRLVQLARGDAARAERLIAAELKRDPTLTRGQAIRSAAERLDYELSR